MTRTGLKRLECVEGCGCLAYMTLSQLERFGLPSCPCGGRMVPEDLEVAALVMSRDELSSVPAWCSFERECSRVVRGQGSHVQRGRQVRAPEAISRRSVVAKAARQSAKARRLSGLVQFSQAAQPAAMPF